MQCSAGGEEWPSGDLSQSPNNISNEPEKSPQTKEKEEISVDEGKANKHDKTIDSWKVSKLPASTSKSDEGPETTAGCTSIEDLPTDIILKIFQYVVHQDSCIPFFKRASRVCKRWHEISQHPILWENLELSYNWFRHKSIALSTLGKFYTSSTKHLELTNWRKFSLKTFQLLRKAFPLLESLALRAFFSNNCLSLVGLLTLGTFSHLKHLEIEVAFHDVKTTTTLQIAFAEIAPRLESLVFINTTVPGSLVWFFEGIFVLDGEVQSFPLKVLDLSQTCFEDHTIPLDPLQRALPHLEVLRLLITGAFICSDNYEYVRHPEKTDDFISRKDKRSKRLVCSTQKKSYTPDAPSQIYLGFPKLRELSIKRYQVDVRADPPAGPNTTSLSWILKRSCDLKIFNLKGCNEYANNSLEVLPMTSLEYFNAKYSNVTHTKLRSFLLKHVDSLLELNVGNVRPTFCDELTLFCEISMSMKTLPLQKLNITGSAVTVLILRDILSVCPSLKSIKTTGCYNLPGDMRGHFTSAEFKRVKMCNTFSIHSRGSLKVLQVQILHHCIERGIDPRTPAISCRRRRRPKNSQTEPLSFIEPISAEN